MTKIIENKGTIKTTILFRDYSEFIWRSYPIIYNTIIFNKDHIINEIRKFLLNIFNIEVKILDLNYDENHVYAQVVGTTHIMRKLKVEEL